MGISRIFTTVSSLEEETFLVQRFGVIEEHIFSSQNTDFEAAIKLLQPTGIDIVVNNLTGQGKVSSWNCVASHGRFLDLIGVGSNLDRPITMQNSPQNISLFAIDMLSLMNEREEVFSTHFARVVQLLEQRAFRVVAPTRSFEVSRVREAFESLRRKKDGMGIAIEMQSRALLPVSLALLSFSRCSQF
jgi:NADPH:quinone reductase-like Zn-dependent oxidoreductase